MGSTKSLLFSFIVLFIGSLLVVEGVAGGEINVKGCSPCKWMWGPWGHCELNGYQSRKRIITQYGCYCPRSPERKRCYYTCHELKTVHRVHITDVYQIRLPSGVHKVYCEMGINGGGYSFISRPEIMKLTPADINVLFRNRKDVLLRISRPDGTQPYTVIRQQRNTGGLTVRLNSYSGQDRAPLNMALRPYILLGTLDKKIAKVSKKIGFYSNNQLVSYTNCDRAGRNFFAFFGNHRELPVSTYHSNNLVYESQGVAVDWRQTAKIPYSGGRLPFDFFLFTEMSFGGCGCYTSSDRWLKAKSPALGTAIGLR